MDKLENFVTSPQELVRTGNVGQHEDIRRRKIWRYYPGQHVFSEHHLVIIDQHPYFNTPFRKGIICGFEPVDGIVHQFHVVRIRDGLVHSGKRFEKLFQFSEIGKAFGGFKIVFFMGFHDDIYWKASGHVLIYIMKIPGN